MWKISDYIYLFAPTNTCMWWEVCYYGPPQGFGPSSGEWIVPGTLELN